MMKRFIAIDAGNSLLKLALFEELKLRELYKIDYHKLELPEENLGNLEGGIISSVVPSKKTLILNLMEKLGIVNPIFLDYKNVRSIKIDYLTPELLGSDRIAIAGAGYYFYAAINKKPALIVSCGSAITLNLVNPDRTFKGGAIFPGIGMMLESLTSKAEKLPDISWKPIKPKISNHTYEAVLSGVAGCIAGAINDFRRIVGPHTLVLTGGDANKIIHLITPPYTIEPELTLKGLALIYLQQESKN